MRSSCALYEEFRSQNVVNIRLSLDNWFVYICLYLNYQVTAFFYTDILIAVSVKLINYKHSYSFNKIIGIDLKA